MKGILTNKTYIYNTRICIHGNFMSLAYIIISHCVSFQPIHQLYGYRSFRKKMNGAMTVGRAKKRQGGFHTILLCVFLTFLLVCLLFKYSQKKCSTNKSQTEYIYICYIVATLCVYIVYLICKSWQQQANCQNGCNLSRNFKTISKFIIIVVAKSIYKSINGCITKTILCFMHFI